ESSERSAGFRLRALRSEDSASRLNKSVTNPIAKRRTMDPIKKLAESEPAKKAASLMEDFQKFAFKGNMIDLAVGLIIGTAFGGIIKSLVENIFMPLISFVLPAEHGYTEWTIKVDDKTIPYGKFLGELVNFLVVALVLYLFIAKFLGWIMR